MVEEEEVVEPLSWWTYVGVGLLWWGSTAVVDAAGVTGEAPYLWIAAGFMATFGLACFVNGRRCGAIHCQISGPGYIGLALLAAASAIGWIGVSRGLLMLLFGGLFVASYAIEYLAVQAREMPV